MKKLTSDQKELLEKTLKEERDNRINDAAKVVLCYDKGVSVDMIASLLYITKGTVYKKLQEYHKSENLKPKHKGSKPIINAEESEELAKHIDENCYVRTKDICAYVLIKYRKVIKVRAMTYWLHAHGFSFKKPKLVPKADTEAQRKFVEFYEELEKKASLAEEPLLFVDSVHPSQQTRPAHGWIRAGHDKVIQVKSGRKRLNIMGGINLENMEFTYETFETIDHEATIQFFKKLECTYEKAKTIHIILDNAGYHKSKEVEKHLKTSRIKLHYLPPRSPNLNSIERLWKVMHEYVSNNKVYDNFKDFKKAIFHFFDDIMPTIYDVLVSRITNSFKIN
jgi:transposase